MSLYFSDEDGVHKSPGLTPISFKSKPSPSPPPTISGKSFPLKSTTPSTKSHRVRRKAQPNQADQVLLNFLSPDNPDIARRAAVEALNSASQSEADSSSEDKNGRSVKKYRQAHGSVQHAPAAQLMSVAQKAMAQTTQRPSDIQATGTESRGPSQLHSPTSPNIMARPRNNSDMGALANRVALVNTTDDHQLSPTGQTSPESPSSPTNYRTYFNGEQPADSTMSSRLRSLSIPQALGAPDTLPAFRAPFSPAIGAKIPENQGTSLPSFQQLSKIAEAASQSIETVNAPQGFPHQRASISSAPGGLAHSPVLVGSRHYSVGSHPTSGSALSPSSNYLPSLAHLSPVTLQGESPRDHRDMFAGRAPPMTLNTSARRPSQASSEHQNYGPLLSSSSESFSPGSQASPNQVPHRMSIDGLTRPIFSPPQNHGQHQGTVGNSLGIVTAGGFRCDHPGCTAAPFQTQYLLKSVPFSCN